MKILIGPSTFGEADPTPVGKLISAGFEVIDNPFKRKLTREELEQLLDSEVVGLVAGLEPLDREVLAKSRLKVISRCGSGMSNVDMDAAADLGIAVYSTPDAPVTAVAELVLGGILSLLRGLPVMDRALHSRKWEKRTGEQLAGKKVAVIGYGRIGRRVGALLGAFDATVLPVDPAAARLVSLHEALPSADVVTLHASGHQCLIGPAEFQLMKAGSYLINAARGGLVDEAALIRALDEGRIAGAFLDTFEKEPYSGPLCEYAQVVLTPHIGSYTMQCRSQMEMESVKNLLAGLQRE